MADLNRAGRSYAQTLISAGKVDKTASWSFSAEDGNALLGSGGNDWANYGKHHLGADTTESFDTKDHWKYPFAKGETVYRSGLVAVRQRAAQQREKAIFDAAGALLDEIDGNSSHQNETAPGPDASKEPIVVVQARPPRIEIQPMMGVESAPPSQEVLARWQAGLRAANSNSPNVIQIFDVIGADYYGDGITAASISEQLKQFGGADVEVQINSPGGDMFEGIAIYNLLRDYAGNVTVKVLALAASAASVIAMAGKDIQVSPSSFIMIHNAWVIAIGNRLDFLEVAAFLAPFDAALRDVYAARTGQKPAQVEAWMDAETFMNGTQAVERNFATGLLPADQVVEDKSATDRARALNAKRVLESNLTRKCGMTRSQARALMNEIGSKPDNKLAAQDNSTKPGAGAAAKHDAGDDDVVALIAAAAAKIKLSS